MKPLILADQTNLYDTKWTSLHTDSFNGNLQVAEHLIAKGATIDAKDIDGFTPLIVAAVKGHLKLVEVFVSNKADINATTKDGRTALHFAYQDNH